MEYEARFESSPMAPGGSALGAFLCANGFTLSLLDDIRQLCRLCRLYDTAWLAGVLDVFF